MKYLLRIVLLSLFLPLTLAAQSKPTTDNLYQHGIYIGWQVGHVDLNNPHIPFSWTDALFPWISKVGSRAFVGYTINDYTAVEIGYDSLAHDDETGGLLQKKNHAYLSGFDVVGKGILPLNTYFSLFIKAGAAYIHQDILESIDNGATILYTSDTHQWLPIVSPGIDLHIMKHLILEGFYTRFFQHHEIHNIDMWGLGLSFTF